MARDGVLKTKRLVSENSGVLKLKAYIYGYILDVLFCHIYVGIIPYLHEFLNYLMVESSLQIFSHSNRRYEINLLMTLSVL